MDCSIALHLLHPRSTCTLIRRNVFSPAIPLLINLPESLLGNAESPYEFTNRGFYEQYGQSYEADHGAQYFEGEKDVR